MTTTNTTTRQPRPGTIRWLSAAGHPGYGRAMATAVRDAMVSDGADVTDLQSVSTYTFNVAYRHGIA
jgi:hypothetical protein